MLWRSIQAVWWGKRVELHFEGPCQWPRWCLAACTAPSAQPSAAQPGAGWEGARVGLGRGLPPNLGAAPEAQPSAQAMGLPTLTAYLIPAPTSLLPLLPHLDITRPWATAPQATALLLSLGVVGLRPWGGERRAWPCWPMARTGPLHSWSNFLFPIKFTSRLLLSPN